MSGVHFTPHDPNLACCGAIRWAGTFSHTTHKAAVTCVECKNTPYYASARQRIPTVPPPGYRHA